MWRSSVRRAMPCTARGTATVKAAKHAQRGFGGPPADHRSHCAVSYPLTPIPVWPHAPRGGAAALWRLGPLHSAAEVEPTTRPEPHSLSVSYGGRSPHPLTARMAPSSCTARPTHPATTWQCHLTGSRNSCPSFSSSLAGTAQLESPRRRRASDPFVSTLSTRGI